MIFQVVAGVLAALAIPVDIRDGHGCLAPPIKGSLRVLSAFHDPNHPFQNIKGSDGKVLYGKHNGVDLAAAQGTSVYAPAGGFVYWAGSDGATGASTVAVKTRRGAIYELVHLSLIAVRRGETVRRGQFLGRTGGEPGKPGSGRFTEAPHLHFGYIDASNRFIDPMPRLCSAHPK